MTDPNTPDAPACTCVVTPTLRTLDRECPVHGDAAERQRKRQATKREDNA